MKNLPGLLFIAGFSGFASVALASSFDGSSALRLWVAHGLAIVGVALALAWFFFDFSASPARPARPRPSDVFRPMPSSTDSVPPPSAEKRRRPHYAVDHWMPALPLHEGPPTLTLQP